MHGAKDKTNYMKNDFSAHTRSPMDRLTSAVIQVVLYRHPKSTAISDLERELASKSDRSPQKEDLRQALDTHTAAGLLLRVKALIYPTEGAVLMDRLL